MSRELDCMVARIFGHDWLETQQDPLTYYATNYACVPEMMAWLLKLGHHVVVLAAADGLVTVHCFRGPLDYSVPMQNGATLPEALARLVVAVAEAKEAGK